jgi:aldose sugar dehydrogenase
MIVRNILALGLTLILVVSLLGNMNAFGQPSINDPSLKIELVTQGLSFPTSMSFLDSDNILVTEKEGNVRLISSGALQPQPVVSLSAVNKNERGLLGIERIGNNIFLYITEDNGDVANKVYKFDITGSQLTNQKLILDLPAGPGTNHQGGKLTTGKDGSLFSVTGELQREGKDQNIQNGPDPDFSGAILRVNPDDGSPAQNNPFVSPDSSTNTLSHYYAYGVRNSFGLAIDPLSGLLWDTENGEDLYDEINLVNPGFNSGWKLVMGPIAQSGISESELVNFPGSKYSDPIFSFKEPIGITEIEFLSSNSLGDKFANNIFVGDIRNGNLYFFKLNEARNGFILDSPNLEDKVADDDSELDPLIIGSGFAGITDIKTGPDGNLYVLSYEDGSIYKISSS